MSAQADARQRTLDGLRGRVAEARRRQRTVAAPTIQRSLDGLDPTGDGWTLYGRAVPYERDQEVTDDGREYYVERFAMGAFARDVAKGGRWVNLFAGHVGDEGDRFLGRCVQLSESDGLYAAIRLNREHPLAEQARSGELTGWSVQARVYASREGTRGGRRVVTREACGLNHIAATPQPQYAGAGVLVARGMRQPAPIRDQYRARIRALTRDLSRDVARRR